MASGFSASGLNYPLLAIPAYYVFSIVPHAYAMSVLKGAGYSPNNANPRASLAGDATKGKVPEEVWARYQRAESVRFSISSYRPPQSIHPLTHPSVLISLPPVLTLMPP